MDITSLIDSTRSVHFRKMFYLVTIVLAGILIVLKYQLLPNINRKENLIQRILRRILDFLIVLIFMIVAVASVTFWISGNE
jgi:glucan phosphoethanolaminetransferase (alkaline phosphatase superfamily)